MKHGVRESESFLRNKTGKRRPCLHEAALARRKT